MQINHFTMVNIQKTWYYHDDCLKDMVLLWLMSKKHGITMVKVQKTWYYHGKYPKKHVLHNYYSILVKINEQLNKQQLNKIYFLQLLENNISQTYTTFLFLINTRFSLSLYLFLPQFFTFKSVLYPCRVIFSWEVFQHSFGMVEAISSKYICADALLTWRETLSSEQQQRSPETPPHLHCERAEAFVVHIRPCSTNYLRIMQVLCKLFLSTDIYRDVTN